MSKVNSLLSKRMKPQTAKSSKKVAALSERSSGGGLAAAFSASELNKAEREQLRAILEQHERDADCRLEEDLAALISITSEVKAITNQAAILHGERIKRAQDILIGYEDGAFTAWLLNTYGNRQTPYNFLQYFLFWENTPKDLRPRIEAMPRQAVYTLASRNGELQEKQKVLEGYDGQSKEELLTQIREMFPLADSDKRRVNVVDTVVKSLEKACRQVSQRKQRLGPRQKELLNHHIDLLRALING